MEGSDQLHAPSAVSPVVSGHETEWFPEYFSTSSWREKFLLSGIELRSSSPITENCKNHFLGERNF
jgi:hypothetical protein